MRYYGEERHSLCLVKNINLFPYWVLGNIKFKEEGSEKVIVYKPEELIAYLSGVDLYFSKKPEDGKSWGDTWAFTVILLLQLPQHPIAV